MPSPTVSNLSFISRCAISVFRPQDWDKVSKGSGPSVGAHELPSSLLCNFGVITCSYFNLKGLHCRIIWWRAEESGGLFSFFVEFNSTRNGLGVSPSVLAAQRSTKQAMQKSASRMNHKQHEGPKVKDPASTRERLPCSCKPQP